MPTQADRLVATAPRRRKQAPGRRKAILRKPAQRRRAVKGATRKVAATDAVRHPSAWLNRLLILTGAVLVVVAAGEAWRTVQRLPVQRITVTGEMAHIQAEEIQELVQASLAGGFLKADLGEIRTQLESLPWVHRATLRRRWPGTLEIQVQEQLAIARWGGGAFLNHEGEIFQPERELQGDALPLLRGPDGSAQMLTARYQRLLELLAPLGLQLEQLAVDERGQVEAVLAGGALLVLGSDDFLPRMQRFATLYRRELAPLAEQVERVDLRYATGVAVAFREPSPEAEPAAAQVAGL